MNFEERVRSNSGFIGVSLFWVSDDIDGLAEEELAKLVERLEKTSAASGMDISAEKIKLMTKKKKKHTSGINTDVKVNGQKLETATSFEHLSSVVK